MRTKAWGKDLYAIDLLKEDFLEKQLVKDWEEKDGNRRQGNDSNDGSVSAWSHETFLFQSLSHVEANVAGFSAHSLCETVFDYRDIQEHTQHWAF